MVWYDKEGRTNPIQEDEFQYSGPPGQDGNPGLSAEESKAKLGDFDETFEWFSYEDGSYGVTSENEPPEGATFVKDLDDFKGAVAAGTDFTTKTFTSAGDVIAESTNPTGTNENPESPESGEGASGSDPLRQLPEASKIIKAGDEFRAVLEFSDGLGAAWYDITSVQYQNLGSPSPSETMSIEAFEGKYGNFYFGNLNEIEVNGDVAWKEMTKSIFAEYGQYIPLDTPELKRLVMQAYLEGWDGEQTKAAYKSTSYYNNMTNQARAYAGMSTAEQASEIEKTQYKLLSHYIYENGSAPPGGVEDLLNKATSVAKGLTAIEGAYYSITTDAEGVEGSAAHRRLNDQISAKNEALGEADGWYSRILNAHNTYQGNHISIDEGHYRELARQLGTKETDWNTVLSGVQNASAAVHSNKDPLLTFNQYSSGAKGIVKGALEIENIANDDSLVTQILSQELSGKDLDKAIRADSRFLKTVRAKDELTSSVNSLGKSLGFKA